MATKEELKKQIFGTPSPTVDKTALKKLIFGESKPSQDELPSLAKMQQAKIIQSEPFTMPWYQSPGLKEQIEALKKYKDTQKVLADPEQRSKLKAAEIGYSLRETDKTEKPNIALRILSGLGSGITGFFGGLQNAEDTLRDWVEDKIGYRPPSINPYVRGAENIAEIAELLGNKKFAEAQRQVANTGTVFDVSRNLAEYSKKNASPFENVVADISSSAGQLIPAIGLQMIGVPMSATMGISQGGQSAQQAKEQGYDINKQLLYGGASGITSALIERIGGLGGGKWAASSVGKKIIESIASEAVEEGIEYPVDWALQRLILRNDVPYDIKQQLYSMGIGGIMGGLFGGTQALSALTKSSNPDVSSKAAEIQSRINSDDPDVAQQAQNDAVTFLQRIANYLKGTGAPTTVSQNTAVSQDTLPQTVNAVAGKPASATSASALPDVLTPVRAQERVQTQETAPSGLGAADIGFDVTGNKLQKMIADYGAIKPGEAPITQERVVELPKQTSPGKNVMQTVRTIMEAPVVTNVTAETIENLVADEKFSREAVTDKGAKERAINTIKSKGYKDALDEFSKQMARGRATKDNVALGFTLLSASEAVGDTKTSVDIITDLVENVRSAAQAVQAVKMLKKMQPEYQLYAMYRSVENLKQDLVGKYGDRAPNLTIDDALAQNLYDALNANDEAKAREAMDAIYRNIAEQIPATFTDKWNAWRYTAMLFNPVTHIKNIVGNYVFRGERFVKNVLSATLQTAAKKLGAEFEPTRAILTKNDAPLIKEAESYYNEDVDAIIHYGKYDDATKKINEYRKIFGQGGKTAVGDFLSKTVGKTVEGGRKLNTEFLEMEDNWVSRPAYINALASYLKANGKTFQTADEGLLTKARAFAILEAQKAAYRDSNAFSDFVANLRYKGNSRVGRAVNLIGEGIMPFRRTPANILLRGLEYSPLGLAKTATIDLGNLVISRKLPGLAEKLRFGDISTAEFLDNLSEGLTGTALTGLGILLASLGVISVGATGDEKKDKFAETQGKQDFALTIGKYTYTIDWLAPAAMPLFIGVSVYNKLTDKRDEGIKLDDALKIASDISDPLLETSMLQSLKDWLEGFGYAKAHDENLIWYGLSQAALSYLSQAVPTIGGRINRTIDKTRRTVYTDPQSGIPTDFQYFVGQQLNKIPGGTYTNQPYVDQWGRVQESGFGERLLQNWVSPGYIKKVTTTPMEKELERLYNDYAKEAEISVLPPATVKKYFTNAGETVYMTADEYTQFKKSQGQYAFKELTRLTESDAYKKMPDDEKAKAVNKVWKAAAEIAKTEVMERRGEMRIPTGDDAKKLQEYISAGLTQDKAYQVYKAIEALDVDLSTSGGKYERISTILKQDLSPKQKAAIVGTYFTSYDEDGSIKEESLLPYLRYASHLLDLYNGSKDSIFISMAVPDKIKENGVEYELTDKEKALFKETYLRVLNSKNLSIYSANSKKDFSRLRNDAFEAAKNAVLMGRR